MVIGPGDGEPDPGAPGARPPAPIEWVELGDTSSAGPAEEIGDNASRPRLVRRPSRPALLVVAVLVGLALVAAVLRHQDQGPSTAKGAGARTAAASGTATSHDDLGPASVPAEVRARPKVVPVAPHLLGVRLGWDLFGLGSGVVIRLQPAAGQLTLTRIPHLASNGPASFVATSSGAVVRPLDYVPGYAVPDGESVRGLLGRLQSGGVAVPGPDSGHLWVDGGNDRRTSMVLVDLDGKPTGQRMVIPSTALGPVFADGAGYVLFSGIGGVYEAHPAGVERVSAGTPVAVGGGRLLAVECDDQYRCATVVLGLTDGSRRVLPADFPPTYALGAISPNGRVAAVPDDRASRLGLRLIDLSTGRTTQVRISLDADVSGVGLVWSPDSTLLFALDANGAVRVVDPRRGSVRGLGVALPPLSQLAIRAPVASSG